MRSHLRPFLSLLAASMFLNTHGHSQPLRVSPGGSNAVLLHDSVDQALVGREMSAADDYTRGRGVAQDAGLAAKSYEKAANAGDPSAQNLMGYLYQTGTGVPQDMVRAVHWYQLSAANGSLNGKVNLAVSYVWGLGVRANPELGESLLKEAAEKGSGAAMAFLGDMYLSGIGSAADAQKAIAYYERGARLHSYYAEYKLAVYLSTPASDPRDLQRSVHLLRKSVSQGYVPAMYLLGLIAVNHPNSKVPNQEALTLLRDASDAGAWRASAVLAILSRDGKWVEKNNEDAYRYFKRAALQDNESAPGYVRKDLQELISTLDSGTLAKLDNEAADWQRTHPVALQLIFRKRQKPFPFSAYGGSLPEPEKHGGEIVSPLSDFLPWGNPAGLIAPRPRLVQ